MKKLMFAVLVGCSMLAFGQEAPKAAPAADPAKAEKRIAREAKSLGISVEDYKKLTPDELKTKLDELKAGRMAKRYGITVDEYRKLTPEQCKAKDAEWKAAQKAAREAKKAERAKAKAAKAAAEKAKAPAEGK